MRRPRDEDSAKAIGLTIRRFLVSIKRQVVQITRISGKEINAKNKGYFLHQFGNAKKKVGIVKSR